MFSVIRFSKFEDSDSLHAAGTEVDRLSPGSFTGPDHVENRFSCTVSDDDDWKNHCPAIEHMISTLAPVIHDLASIGVEVELDVAIDLEDYQGRLLVLFPLERDLMRILLDNNVSLTLSLYGTTT